MLKEKQDLIVNICQYMFRCYYRRHLRNQCDAEKLEIEKKVINLIEKVENLRSSFGNPYTIKCHGVGMPLISCEFQGFNGEFEFHYKLLDDMFFGGAFDSNLKRILVQIETVVLQTKIDKLNFQY